MAEISYETERRHCRLQYAAGRVEACPEEPCPFWEQGGAVLAARCAVEQVDLTARPELASWLLGLRADLETPRSSVESDRVRRLFYRLRDGDPDE